MPAITKTWTSVADAAVDPDSPGTTGLFTALRDNIIVVREWLGAGYTAGAVQDHNHDGINSARVEVGGNYLRNGSFEDGEAGWTLSDYSGGSHAISTAQRRHGAQSLAITSTVLANGGGDALSNEYIAVAEGQPIWITAWVLASVGSISAKIQLLYYDAALSLVSTVDAYTTTSAPTSWTRQTDQDTVPANARWVRVKVICGVPASGAATGTIYVDGVTLGLAAPQRAIESAAVGQAQLKSTTSSDSIAVNSGSTASITLAGGSFGWYTISADDVFAWGGGSNLPAGVLGFENISGSSPETIYVDERYVQASPPYDLGNGEVPLFVWALVDNGTGAIVGTQIAPDPPWAYNGPTDITPQYWRGGKPWRRDPVVGGQTLRLALRDQVIVNQLLRGEAAIDYEEREIDNARKNADINIVPHPFGGDVLTGRSVVLLDPVGAIAERLQAIHASEHARVVRDLLLQDYLRLDNAPLAAHTPPGVIAVAAKFRDSK